MTGALMASIDLPGFAVPDPGVPAARLAGIDAGALQRAASWLAGCAAALAGAAADGAPAVGQTARGWSNPQPALGITRLLSCTERTAALLHTFSVALDGARVVVQDEQSNAHYDVAIAVTEMNDVRSTPTLGKIAGALLGVTQVADATRILAVNQRLTDALTARLRRVELAIADLLQQLSSDPTEGPDGLRAGPTAVLPPDPVNNPAQRTDAGHRAAMAADLHSGDPNRMKFALSIRESLQHADRTGAPAELVVYDATAFHGQGRAAIAVGDLTTATNVAVVVPGIANSPSAMSGGIDLAADLRAEAARQDPAEQTAVVAWYGYDMPASWTKDPGPTISTGIRDTVAVGSAANAAAGAPLLAADLTALTSMAQTSARMTVVGFSMGATTVSEAAKFDLPVDSVVLLGSPGAGWATTTAAGYGSVPASGVYSLSYDQDPVTLPITDQLAAGVLGNADPYGVDPAAETFGGNHIDVQTNVPINTGAGLVPAVERILGDPAHHSMKNYMEGPALAAEAAIVVGRGRSVPVKQGRK